MIKSTIFIYFIVCMTCGFYLFSDDDRVEGVSLLGTELIRPELRGEVETDLKNKLDAALTEYKKDPDNIENIIWLARRTAYTGKYQEAIRIYSDGIR